MHFICGDTKQECIEFSCRVMQYFKYECTYQINKAANGIRFDRGRTVFLLRRPFRGFVWYSKFVY